MKGCSLESQLRLCLTVSLCVITPILPIHLSAQTPAFIGKNFLASGNGAPAAGDFNGDGKVDLALAGAAAMVLLGNGDGTFQPPVQYTAGTSPLSIAVGDFNGDGKLDLALSDAVSSAIFILLGNGDGTFQPANRFPTAPGAQTASIAVADFNGDGMLDVAVVDQAGCDGPCSTIEVLLGKGDGTLQPARAIPVGADPSALAVGDFNLDGVEDIAVTWGSGNLSILLGNGDGTFQPPLTIALGTNTPAGGIAVADFNGDGRQDLAVAGGASNSISVLLGNGNGTFNSPVNITDNLAQEPAWVAVADFNGDGKQDLAVALSKCCSARDEGAFGVMLGDGSGNFQSLVRYLVPGFTVPNSSSFLAVADFNGDGKPDVALPTSIGVLGGTTVMTNTTGVAPAPLAIGSLTLGQASVTGGFSVAATVTLAPGAVAPVGSLLIPLANTDSSVASVPASIQIIQDMANVNFGIPTNSVGATSSAVISASYGGVTRNATLTVNPPAAPPVVVAALTLNPATVVGGDSSQGTVTLSGPAPSGGATVMLASSSTTAIPGNSAVMNIPAGQTSATFPITTSGVTTTETAMISAFFGGVTQTATLTITPPAATVSLVSLTLNPTSVKGGNTSQGTVTFDSALSKVTSVTLSSSNPAAATVPDSMTIAPGSTRATFTISTSGVYYSTSVTITATAGGVTKTAVLTVTGQY